MLAKNLRYLREKRGLVQSQMTDYVNVSRTKWVDYERGKASPPIETVFKIAEFFQVDAKDLVFTDLENVHLTENGSVEKNAENVHLNVHPNVHPNAQTPLTLAHRHAAEVPPLWAIGMLQKLEQLAADMEALKKDDNNAESRVGAA
jgi:transcriptional regulator with XRE-family HTH domain